MSFDARRYLRGDEDYSRQEDARDPIDFNGAYAREGSRIAYRNEVGADGKEYAVEQYDPLKGPSGIVNMKNKGGFKNDKAFQYNKNDNTIVGRHGGTRMAGDKIQQHYANRAKAERELERYGDGSRLKELDQKRRGALKNYGEKRRGKIAEGEQVARLGKGFGRGAPSRGTQDYQDYLNAENPIYSSSEFGFGTPTTNREAMQYQRDNF